MSLTLDLPHTDHPNLATVGQLKASGYRYRGVKQEIRENLLAALRRSAERNQGGIDDPAIFPGVRGYRETVIPQIVHGLLARHDMLLLGLRGQAKTRMLRDLPRLLDEWIPIVDGLEVPDDPIAPALGVTQRRIAEHGDDTPIRWLHRSDRYQEKLATPDVTIADLIGEIDLVKHAQGRHLSDESTMHFGLIPRANRGIFAVNELPDLAPRIQVGLFNVLEERDVQIRGYPVRLNLDVMLVFSANPEDYTNRGRIVTPLKDRIGTAIRTHYPETLDDAMAIASENAWVDRHQNDANNGSVDATIASPQVEMPVFLHRVIEEAIRQARTSPHINQASGVSVRASIACLETIVSASERRGLDTRESNVVARPCDLHHLTSALRGKIELMLADEGEDTQDKLVMSLVGEAIKAVFDEVATIDDYEHLADGFEDGLRLTVDDSLSAEETLANLKHIDGLLDAADELAEDLNVDLNVNKIDPITHAGRRAAVAEFLLEALYVHDRLSKHAAAGKGAYSR